MSYTGISRVHLHGGNITHVCEARDTVVCAMCASRSPSVRPRAGSRRVRGVCCVRVPSPTLRGIVRCGLVLSESGRSHGLMDRSRHMHEGAPHTTHAATGGDEDTCPGPAHPHRTPTPERHHLPPPHPHAWVARWTRTISRLTPIRQRGTRDHAHRQRSTPAPSTADAPHETRPRRTATRPRQKHTTSPRQASYT